MARTFCGLSLQGALAPQAFRRGEHMGAAADCRRAASAALRIGGQG